MMGIIIILLFTTIETTSVMFFLYLNNLGWMETGFQMVEVCPVVERHLIITGLKSVRISDAHSNSRAE